MWFILESLPTMPLEALTEAGDKLIEGLQLMMPGAQIESALIGPGAN
jgi:DNA/RNA-binding domain of Phe-tRNA-synthetase-like protein